LDAGVTFDIYLTYSMEQESFEELTGFKLVNKFSAFYGNHRLVTAFTSARYLSLSLARSIQSIPLPEDPF
jgi:hypothetical protein